MHRVMVEVVARYCWVGGQRHAAGTVLELEPLDALAAVQAGGARFTDAAGRAAALAAQAAADRRNGRTAPTPTGAPATWHP